MVWDEMPGKVNGGQNLFGFPMIPCSEKIVAAGKEARLRAKNITALDDGLL